MQFPKNIPPDKGGGNSRRRNQKKVSLSEFPALTSPQGSSSGKPKSAKEILLQNPKQNPKFFQKHVLETVIHLGEDDIIDRSNPWDLKEKYLGTQSYMVSEAHHRYFYESILIETGSVDFTHHRYNESDPKSSLTYSKCYVRKVLAPAAWGFVLSHSKILKSNGHHFNYWDYVQAWFYAFYYQNGSHNHSWLFSINPDILKGKGFPPFFFHWWEKFGPTTEILPSEISKHFLIWENLNPKLKGEKPFGKNTLLFFTEFRITWIWKWDLQFNFDNLKIPVLQRTYFFKWWDNYDSAKCEKEVFAAVMAQKLEHDRSEKEIREKLDPKTNIFDFLSEVISQKNPSLSTDELQVEVLKTLKSQFISSSSRISEAASSVKSEDEGSGLNQQSRYYCLAGESEDQLPSDNEDEQMQDFMDAMISIQEKKAIAKGKGIKSLDDL